jgi:hypothetical protein
MMSERRRAHRGRAAGLGIALACAGSVIAQGSDIKTTSRSAWAGLPGSGPGAVTVPVDLGDLEALARSAAGLGPGREPIDRLADRPGAREALLPSDATVAAGVTPAALVASAEPVLAPLDAPMARPEEAGVGPAGPTDPGLVPVGVPIPEPASVILVVTGALGLYIRGRLRRSLAR